MILVASRGQAFSEDFTFKNEAGRVMPAPTGTYSLTLEHGDFAKQYPASRAQAGVVWNMTADEVAGLQYSNYYFALYFNGKEVTRGVLRVQ